MNVEKLIEYLELNKTKSVGDYYHHRLILDVMERFQVISRNPPFRKYREIILQREGEKEEGRVDLAVANSLDEVYLVEGKVLRGLTPSKKQESNLKNTINRQLRLYHRFFMDTFGISPRAIGVYRQERTSRFRFYRLPMEQEEWMQDALSRKVRGKESR